MTKAVLECFGYIILLEEEDALKAFSILNKGQVVDMYSKTEQIFPVENISLKAGGEQLIEDALSAKSLGDTIYSYRLNKKHPSSLAHAPPP